jgi:hypothetical protein
LVSILGNLIILAISSDSRLHTTMYFFLSNLSFTYICVSTITVPKIWWTSGHSRSYPLHRLPHSYLLCPGFCWNGKLYSCSNGLWSLCGYLPTT